MLYTILGVLVNLLLLLNIYGIWLQLILILKRKRYVAAVTSRVERARGGATALLSLNHFTVRFVAFFAIALYGASLDTFNHFLVWSHLAGALLLLGIITEIYRERRDGVSQAMLLFCSALLCLGLIAWTIGDGARSHAREFAEILLLFMAFPIAQSDLHQVHLIRSSGTWGAISLRMHQTTVIKDCSVVLFGLTMGLSSGWPVMIAAGTSVITKSLLLWHARWARLSPVAAERKREKKSAAIELPGSS